MFRVSFVEFGVCFEWLEVSPVGIGVNLDDIAKSEDAWRRTAVEHFLMTDVAESHVRLCLIL